MSSDRASLAAQADSLIRPAQRAALLQQRPCTVWLTGLSGAGKSTIANALEARLHALGRPSMLLDADALRHRLNHDLGFSDAHRAENIRRIAEVACLMGQAGLITIVAAISPFRAAREQARALFAPGEFIEVFVDAPLAVAEARDPKGLYRRARQGELPLFTGIGSNYEAPTAPDLRVDTVSTSAAQAAEQILALLTGRGLAR